MTFNETLRTTLRPRGVRASYRSRRGQRGQALPLAAIGLLVMALAVIATLNLGQAVHEKIRLQNSADAAAYSLAALEARAFNFIALTNRTQIVHYNTAMAVQSYLSYTGYCMALFGTLRDIFQDMSLIAQTGCTTIPPPANSPFCIAKGFLMPVANVLSTLVSLAKIGYKVAHKFGAWIIDAMTLFNKHAIWQMQTIRALQVNTHLITGMNDFVKENDPAMTYTAKNQWFNILLNSVLNSLEYQATWDRGAGINPFWLDAMTLGIFRDIHQFKPNPTKDEVKDAYRVMTEIANASRSHENIYDRSGGTFSTWLFANVFGRKMGATKLVEDGDPSPKIDEIHQDDHYKIGDCIASDDYLTMGLGFGYFGVVGVVLMPNGVKQIGDGILTEGKTGLSMKGGHHYRYEDPGRSGAAPGGLTAMLPIPFPPSGGIKNPFKRDADTDHAWRGLAPFYKFKPNSEQNSDFNQPSTWMFLNKDHSGFQSGSGSKGRPWHYKNITWNGGGGSNSGVTTQGEKIGGADVTGSVSLDTTIGGERNSYLFEGLNVVSRGLVYYHRPGAWEEHPNMFNPFWRARLAPVGAKLMNVFDRFLGSKIRTSSDSRIAQAIVNMVRGFVSDFFLRTVTAVMTH